MENKNGIYYDLITLLKLGIDIRRVARNNLTMKSKEYYSMLTKFLNHAPSILASLNNIANGESTEVDFLCMTPLKTMLEDIGCYKYGHIIDDIISSDKRGHIEFAVECTKKLIDMLNTLITEISEAKRTEDTDSVPDTISEKDIVPENTTESYAEFLLKKVLKILDHDEATRKLRILAVDDAPVMLKTISSVLSEDYRVYGMTDPTMLEKFLHQITPELFLLDYQMPERSGFDLIPIIRSFKEHKDTPIIFLTSLGTSDHVSAALTLGACDFIVKPFHGNILREKIAKHIVRKKLF